MSSSDTKKPKFSVAITTSGYQKLINNTLGDPLRAQRFISSITSAVAVNPALQECEAGSILAGALLGESMNLQPSPQLGQYYLVPFKMKEKRDRNGNIIQPACTKAQFVLGYKGYIQLALRTGQYKKLNVIEIKEGKKSLQRYKDIMEVTAGRMVPDWLEADPEALKGTVKELPLREAIDVPVDEMMIVELYSK